MWFWIIKILCTTVGESFADWISVTLRVGLHATALSFTVALAAILVWQLRLDRYVPGVYWLTVVVFSVTGTLYTDILTDDLRVPLAVSTGVFTVALAGVFGVWFAREHTLSIHSITTPPRELFYWLAVLVTFALGTAAGDWTLQITGWGPGVSVLLPAGVILAIVVGWRMGADAVLSFWLAYILTRPLGANLGDWIASPRAARGLGLGTATTSAIFLAAILATVVYLTVTRADVIDGPARAEPVPPGQFRAPTNHAGLLRLCRGRGRCAAHLVGRAAAFRRAGRRRTRSDSTGRDPAPGQLTAHFPPTEIAKFRAIAEATLVKVQAGDQNGAKARITDLETAWDEDESTLRPVDRNAWGVIDHQLDDALQCHPGSHPDTAAEVQTLNTLLTSLRN